MRDFTLLSAGHPCEVLLTPEPALRNTTGKQRPLQPRVRPGLPARQALLASPRLLTVVPLWSLISG